MLIIPVIGITLSLAVLPTVAKGETTEKKSTKTKKKKSTGTGLSTVAPNY